MCAVLVKKSIDLRQLQQTVALELYLAPIFYSNVAPNVLLFRFNHMNLAASSQTNRSSKRFRSCEQLWRSSDFMVDDNDLLMNILELYMQMCAMCTEVHYLKNFGTATEKWNQTDTFKLRMEINDKLSLTTVCLSHSGAE